MSKDFFDNLNSTEDNIVDPSGAGDFAIISYAQDLPATFEELQGAHFSRQEGSLKIVFEDEASSILVKDYFLSGNDGLVTQDGASIPHSFVETFLLGDSELLAAIGTAPVRFIGSVEEIDGAVAMLAPSGARTLLNERDLIIEGSQIITDKGARVELQMEDGSKLTLAGNARVSLDEINFDADSGGGSIIISLLRGIFSFASGLVARAEPENVTLYTPTSEIGLRGTKIAGEVAADGKAKIVLIDGRIEVATKGGSVNIDKPLGVTEIRGDGSAPGPIQQLNMQGFLGQFDGLFENAQELRSFARAKEAQQANEQVLEANADSQAQADQAPTNPALFSQSINFDQATGENPPDTSIGEAGNQNNGDLEMKISDYLKELQKIKLDPGDDFSSTVNEVKNFITNLAGNADSGPITAQELNNLIQSLETYSGLIGDLLGRSNDFVSAVRKGSSTKLNDLVSRINNDDVINEIGDFKASLTNLQNSIKGLAETLKVTKVDTSLKDYNFSDLNNLLNIIPTIRDAAYTADATPGDNHLENMENAAKAIEDSDFMADMNKIITDGYIIKLYNFAKDIARDIAKAVSLADDDQAAALEQIGYQSTSKEDHALLVDSENGNS